MMRIYQEATGATITIPPPGTFSKTPVPASPLPTPTQTAYAAATAYLQYRGAQTAYADYLARTAYDKLAAKTVYDMMAKARPYVASGVTQEQLDREAASRAASAAAREATRAYEENVARAREAEAARVHAQTQFTPRSEAYIPLTETTSKPVVTAPAPETTDRPVETTVAPDQYSVTEAKDTPVFPEEGKDGWYRQTFSDGSTMLVRRLTPVQTTPSGPSTQPPSTSPSTQPPAPAPASGSSSSSMYLWGGLAVLVIAGGAYMLTRKK